jgi:hypothetical protein
MLLTYTRTNPNPLAEFGNLAAGLPPLSGPAVTRPPRGVPRFWRQVERRDRQTPPEWAMLDETLPANPAQFLPATRVPPRLAGGQAGRFRRPNLPCDAIATLGPGLSARPPFVGVAAGPRYTARDFLLRARRYRQVDPRGAMSGLTGRSIGSFAGSKFGFLTVQGHRSVTTFKVTPHRGGSLTAG